MSRHPDVTVVCATRNALDAVRLTFSSFRRHTPEPVRVLVADNGSTDGTLEFLSSLGWVEVVPLAERRRRAEAARGDALAAAEALGARLDAYARTLGDGERAVLDALRAAAPLAPPPVEDAALAEHGATLDWLAAQVETPLFVTLDSDVELLETGWLGRLVDVLEAEGLDALGTLEPGYRGYRPRLAPALLLLRTASFRALRASFRGYASFANEDERRRWAARPPSFAMRREELDRVPSARIYPVAAAVFEALERTGGRWRDLPADLRRSFVHHEHLSWAAGADAVPDALRAHHADRLAAIRARLREYEPA